MSLFLAAVRKIGLLNLALLLNLLIGVNCLSAGLGTIVRGASLSAFFPVATAAALLGWWLASGRLKGWQAWIGILALGVLLLTGLTAQLGTPLLALARLLPGAEYRLFLWIRERIPADLSDIAGGWNIVVTQYAQVWQRVAHWAQSSLNGSVGFDPVMLVLAWSLLLWPIAAWAGWFLRGHQALVGMAPALVLLALVGNYTGAQAWPVWGTVSITLLLMGLMRYQENMARWAGRGIDFAEIIQGDTLIAVAAVTIALATLAWFVPLVSLKSITDALRQHQPPNKSSQTIANALGLVQATAPPSDFAPYVVSQLPNEHLIHDPPELLQTPVMSISTGELAATAPGQPVGSVPHHHWRSTTFDRYTGSGWSSSPAESEDYPASAALFNPVPAGYRVLYQRIRLAGPGDGKLYWDGTLASSDASFEVGWRTRPASGGAALALPFGGADILAALSDAKTYQVESLLPNFSVEQLRNSPPTYPDAISARYLGLPNSVPERVLALARDLTAVPPTPYDRAVAIETYLRKTYPYSLDLPSRPPGKDVADYFLFELKKGYCDYFATAMAVLARAAGLPSRVVIGYASGAYDATGAKYDIVQADAHAWVEVYFSGIGWVEFEPTPSQPGMERSVTQPFPDQVRPPAVPQGDLDNLLALLQGRPGVLPPWSALAMLILAMAVALAVLQFGEHLLLSSISTPRAMQNIYRGIYRLARNPGQPAPAGETPSEFAAGLRLRLDRLSRQDFVGRFFGPAPGELELLTGLYLRAVYTPQAPQKAELRRALRAWRGLRGRLLLARVIRAKERER